MLTAQGSQQLEVVHAYRRQRFATAMNDWTATERETFGDLLTRFVTGLDR